MSFATVNGISLWFETHGDTADAPVLLVHGLGRQLTDWPGEFVERLRSACFCVVVFDNRDSGLSDKLDHLGKARILAMVAALRRRLPFQAPYALADMADDAVGLIDHLGFDRVHAVGVSMGGMIVQEMAIRHSARLRSIVSIMSSTGSSRVGRATPDAARTLFDAPPQDTEAAIAQRIQADRIVASPGHFDESEARRRTTAAFERGFHPPGVGRQLVALYASGNRTNRLQCVHVPTLVIHGTADPLIDVSGGRATAEAIPGARLVEIQGMGHDLVPAFFDQVLGAIIPFLRMH